MNPFKKGSTETGAQSPALGDFNDELDAAYLQIGELADQLARASADLEKERGESDVEKVKARLLEPYINRVFLFVEMYCVVVGEIICLSAIVPSWFKLPESILAIIAGSTAVSVIGLIGLVITGLFGRKSLK